MRLCLISQSLPDPLVIEQYLHLGPDFDIELLTAASGELSAQEVFDNRVKDDSLASVKFQFLPVDRDEELRRKEISRYAETADVVQSLDGSNRIVEYLCDLRRQYGCRVVVNAFANCVRCAPVEPKEKEMIGRLAGGVNAFLVHTRGARRILLMSDVPEDRIHLIPPGVDCSKVETTEPDMDLAQTLGITDSHFVVFAWCPLRWENGVYEILGAAKEILRWGKQDRIRILIFGSGPERDSLRRFVRLENLGGFVAIGKEPHPGRIPGILGLTDLFAVPSIPTREWSEPLPMRMLLAMAAGVPVVASDTGEIPDFLSNGGILIPPRQYYDLADSIIKFSERPGNLFPYSKAAKARAKDQFDIKLTVSRLKRFYEGLVSPVEVKA